jgi:hypothetical protein
MIIQVTNADLKAAESRTVQSGPGVGFGVFFTDLSKTVSKLSPEVFYDDTRFSHAMEIRISKMLGFVPRTHDDRGPDFPNGVEMLCRSPVNFHLYGGHAYVVRRAGLWHPTLSLSRIPGEPLAAVVEAFIEPGMVPRARFSRAFPATSSRQSTTILPSSAKELGACRDVWRRFCGAVLRDELNFKQQLQQHSELLQQRLQQFRQQKRITAT